MIISKIKSVKPVGVKKTIDLEVDHKDHNFYANDILISNSHSVCYSYLSVLCAYLKINYPAHFFKNCLILARTFQNSDERIQQICKELPYFGVSLKPPDLIKSSDDFTVDGNTIRYGLQSIKSVSEKSLAKLKNFNTDAKNKFALFQAAKEAGINIGILSNLIKAGCLSSFGENRGLLMLEAASWNLLTESQKTKIVKYGPKYEYNLLNILFDIKEGKLLHEGKEIISTKKRATKDHPEGSSPWDSFYRKYEKFKGEFHAYNRYKDFYNYKYENSILGFSYSKKLYEILKSDYKDILNLQEIEDAPIDSKVITCGIVQEAKLGKTQKGNAKLTILLSDEFGQARCMMFSYEKYNREDHSREWVKNVEDLKNEYGRFPEKGDLILTRSSKKDKVLFADKIKILNLDFEEKT
jgi:DNA polymerase III alpha subunit